MGGGGGESEAGGREGRGTEETKIWTLRHNIGHTFKADIDTTTIDMCIAMIDTLQSHVLYMYVHYDDS